MSKDEHNAFSEPVAIARHLAGSETFSALFREGMSLVEETAAYLDGDGRRESKTLERAGALTYATESMRLTTRLMQLASWLLLQRAVNEGEMTAEQATEERSKVRIDRLSSAREGAGWDELPEALRELINRSVRLQERIMHLDGALDESEAEAPLPAENPVADHFGRLAEAFGGGLGGFAFTPSEREIVDVDAIDPKDPSKDR